MHRLVSHRTGILVFRAAPNPLWGRWFGCPGASVGRRTDTRTACQLTTSTNNDLHHASRPQTGNISLAFAQQLMQYLGRVLPQCGRRAVLDGCG